MAFTNIINILNGENANKIREKINRVFIWVNALGKVITDNGYDADDSDYVSLATNLQNTINKSIDNKNLKIYSSSYTGDGQDIKVINFSSSGIKNPQFCIIMKINAASFGLKTKYNSMFAGFGWSSSESGGNWNHDDYILTNNTTFTIKKATTSDMGRAGVGSTLNDNNGIYMYTILGY